MQTVKNDEIIHMTNFVLNRQTKDSSYSHWDIPIQEIIKRVYEAGIENQQAGYREGVTVVKLLNAEGFYSPIIELKEGMKIYGEFQRRKENEEPRRETYVISEKQKAKTVFAVLYHKDVLAEKNENETSSDWEIVAILASPSEDEKPSPMPVSTLLANHFEFSGGTATKMSDSQFIEALKESATYWKNKVRCKGKV